MCRDTRTHGGTVEIDGMRSFDAETRRSILETLDARPRISQLDHLADALATDWTASRDRLRLRLHHEFLPRLEDDGEVLYEPTSRYVVRLG